jgi:outer membrane protein OmpA-like peptidoglycan-associated protein/tetratricopeptide (TPR) repeat protein
MRIYSFLIILFCILLLPLESNGQQLHTESKKAIKFFKEALSEFQGRKDDNALVLLDKALKADDTFVEAYMMQAQIFKDRGEFERSISSFEKALSLDPDFNPEGYLVLANVQFNIGLYENAQANIQTFLDKGRFSQISKSEGMDFLEKTKFAIQAVNNPVPFNPENLGDSINSELNEYRPTLSLDKQRIIFTVMLPKDPSKPADMNNVQEDFFISDKNETGVWKKRESAGKPLNTDRNEGAQSLSADGRTLYFTACDRMEGFGRCDIYYSVLTAGRWSQAINLGSGVNSKYSDKHPSVSSDGRILYFASNRPGGYGGLDLWYSIKGKNGSWGMAVNMGSTINTPGNEQSPFIHPDNQSLYFASEGHENLGRGDVFISRRDSMGEWGKPQNLGYPINTYNDEIGLIVDPNGQKAYFSSNRNPEKGMDIFVFDLPEKSKPVPVSYMKGRVYDARTFKGIQAEFELIDLETGIIVMQARSNAFEGDFLVPLPTNKNYALNVSHPGYLFYSDYFEFIGIHKESDPYLKNVPLKPIRSGESIVLNNIFFEFDSYKLKEESKVELNKLLEFLNLNPDLKAEISGHTDNIGTDAYNQKLSRDRARSVVNHLISRGIDISRLSFEGYGSSKPLASNETEEGRAQNRRTEFKIMED